MLDTALQISLYVFLGLVGLGLLYYSPRLICYFAPFKKQKHLINHEENRILVMVPARNESSIIRGIMNCLSNQTYNKDKFDVVFIVKTNDDPTIDIAKEYGFTYLIASEQRNKEEALDICLTEYNKAQKFYDVYMVIDADCWLEKDCLSELNNGFASSADIVTCKKMSKNYILRGKNSGSISGMCNGTIWPLIDELGNRFKSDHHLYQMPITTGIAFKKSVLDATDGFKFNKTMTEDMEMMYATPLYGFKQYYCSYSMIYMDEAESFKVTTTRRNRWLKGYVDSHRLYDAKLKKVMTSKRDILQRYYLNGLYPTFVIYGFVTFYLFTSLLCSLAFLLTGFYSSSLICFINALVSFSFMYISFFIMTLFVLIVDWKKMKCPIYKRFLVLFLNPIFELGYIKVCYHALFGKQEADWVPIERNATVEGK